MHRHETVTKLWFHSVMASTPRWTEYVAPNQGEISDTPRKPWRQLIELPTNNAKNHDLELLTARALPHFLKAREGLETMGFDTAKLLQHMGHPLTERDSVGHHWIFCWDRVRAEMENSGNNMQAHPLFRRTLKHVRVLEVIEQHYYDIDHAEFLESLKSSRRDNGNREPDYRNI
jgi:hypothetical protein